jgi:hypothetical protein
MATLAIAIMARLNLAFMEGPYQPFATMSGLTSRSSFTALVP